MLHRSAITWFDQLQGVLFGRTPSEYKEPALGIEVSFQADSVLLRRFHSEVLKKCFHKHDLDSSRQLIANVRSGDYVVALAREGDEILGGIVIEHSWSMGKKVMLIAWVAVEEKHRGRDIGTLLVNQAISYAKANEALILLGEVENPDEFEEEGSAYGNPVKRVKFYSRFDCQYLSVPYVVPLRNGQNEFGMMLTLFPLSAEQVSATEMSSPEFALFMEEFVGNDETSASEALIEASKGIVRMVPYKKLFGS